MTREDGKDIVSLSPRTWIGLITVAISLGGFIGTPVLVLQGRMTTVEVKQENMQRQMDAQEIRSTSARNEILGAIKDLRTELKAK